VSKGEKSEIKKIPFDMDKKDMDKKKPSLVGYWKKIGHFLCWRKNSQEKFLKQQEFLCYRHFQITLWDWTPSKITF